MRPVLVIASKDLRQRLRDRTAYIVGVVAPLVLATLISLAFAGSGFDFHATYAVIDLDHGELARTFVDDVLGGKELLGTVKTRIVDDIATAERLAEDGDVAAAIVIPNGLSDQARPKAIDLRVVRSGDVNRLIGADVAVSIAEGFVAQVEAVRLATETAIAAKAASGQAIDPATLSARAASMPSPIDAVERGAFRADVPQGSIFAPGMGIFFLFYVVGFGAQSLMAERRDGTLARLLAAPVPSRSILVGKAAASYVLGVASLATMAVASSILLDARWGDAVSAATLILATVFAVTGIAAMVLALARTEAQVRLSFAVVTFVFALLGGNFVNLSNAPDLLQRLSLLTPNGWALRAFGDLASEGGGISTALPAIAALVAFGIITWSIAIGRSRKLVTP